MASLGSSLFVSLVVGRAALAFECPRPFGLDGDVRYESLIPTDEISLEAESTSGAVGDVVGLTFLFTSRATTPGWPDLNLAVCHDPEVLEIVGRPVFTDDLLSLLNAGPSFYPVPDAAYPTLHYKGNGFILSLLVFNPDAYAARFPSEAPLPLMTVYYRIKGRPGMKGSVAFCDAALERHLALCNYNSLHVVKPGGPLAGYDYLPATKISGTVTVLEGPATRPDRPPDPPIAKIYPERPADEAVNFRVRITGADAVPGARDVRVQVYVRADVEYTAVLVPIDYDERYLRLARAEDHFMVGQVLVNDTDELPGGGPEEGCLVVTNALGIDSRRVAAEGEEVHAATLYFNVLESAREVMETALDVVPVVIPLRLEPHHLFKPQIGVQHRTGPDVNDPAVRTEIAPISITKGVVNLRPRDSVRLGDANHDGGVDITDAVVVLLYLFQGGFEPECAGAADFNGDGRLDIADPIGILARLFLWSEFPAVDEAAAVPCNA